MLTNWAGNHVYAATHLHHPESVEEVQQVVAGSARIRALGSRHSFTDVADSLGELVSTAGLPVGVEVDSDAPAGAGRGRDALRRPRPELHRQGWALATMASLPHISVAGAVATGTHGSGDRTGSLAAAVTGLEYVAPDGELRAIRSGDPDFDGHVVSLGALGITTHVTLAVEPTYDVRQDLWTGLPWDDALQHLDELTASAYSVSLFTDWTDGGSGRCGSRAAPATLPTELWGAARAAGTLHMLAGAEVDAVTAQGGVVGPWHERLPHFRMDFTPSRGEELQSEYLVPRSRAREALEQLRPLAPRFAHLLQVTEIRTVAADALWLSGAYETDVVGLHFTWVREQAGVYAVLPAIEEVLLPLGARPHWGKCFVAPANELRAVYPRFDDFRALVERLDPEGKLGNDFLGRHLDL